MPRGVYIRTPEIRASLSAHALERHESTGWCQIEGCDRPANTRANICERHYYRIRRTGSTELKPSRRKYPPSYRNAHRWVELDRGKAASHDCVDCGEQAAHWSFAHRRVPEQDWLWTEKDGRRPYSGNPTDYDPRCNRCAHRYDRPY